MKITKTTKHNRKHNIYTISQKAFSGGFKVKIPRKTLGNVIQMLSPYISNSIIKEYYKLFSDRVSMHGLKYTVKLCKLEAACVVKLLTEGKPSIKFPWLKTTRSGIP